MGPKTPEGKSRVRHNALKHGMTAATIVLPGEDAARLEARVAAWKEDVQPRSAMEDYLVERAAHVSWQLDRADRTIAARLTGLIADAPLNEATEEADLVADLGRQLFRDPRGPIARYPRSQPLPATPPRNRPETDEEPFDPARIVNRLEALPTGCQWLLDRWTELRQLLDDGRKWQPPDRLRAIRLLGQQPIDALDDPRVLAIYLACNAMNPGGPSSFADLYHEMNEAEMRVYVDRLLGRGVRERQLAGPAAGQAALRAIIEQAVTRLQALVAAHRERQALSLPGWLDARAFDDSAEGERMRRYQQTHSRALNSAIQTLFKVRKELGDRSEDLAVDADVAGVESPMGDAPESGTTELSTGGCEMVEAGWAGPPLGGPAAERPTQPEPVAANVETASAAPEERSDETNPAPVEEPSNKTNPAPGLLPTLDCLPLEADESLFRKGVFREGEPPGEPISPADAARQEPRPPTSGTDSEACEKTNPGPAEPSWIVEPATDPEGPRPGAVNDSRPRIPTARGPIGAVGPAGVSPSPSRPHSLMHPEIVSALARVDAAKRKLRQRREADSRIDAAVADFAEEIAICVPAEGPARAPGSECRRAAAIVAEPVPVAPSGALKPPPH